MRLLTYEQLRAEKGIPYCRDHLRRKCKKGEFPSPIELSESRIAWLEGDVDAWIGQRAASSRWRAPDAEPPPLKVGPLREPQPRAPAHNGVTTSYLACFPDPVPDGEVLVHNRVRPAKRGGTRGFRFWLQVPSPDLSACHCGWAAELGQHFTTTAAAAE